LNFTRLIQRVARLRPDSQAVLAEDRTLSYLELWRAIASAGQFYLDSGVIAGDRILLVLPNGTEFVQFHFGVLKIGAISVPVRSDYTGWEVRRIAANCNPAVLLATSEWLARNQRQLQLSERTRVITLEEAVSRLRPGDDCAVHVNSSAIASINYSYFGDGYPKGAMLTHANHIYAATGHAKHHGFLATDRLLVILPMCHVYALSGCVNSGLVRGATLVLGKHHMPRGIFADIERHRATVVSSVPAMFECLANYPRKDRYDLGCLRRLITGGAYMAGARELEIQLALGAEIVQGYGLTECFPVICNPAGPGNRHGTLGIPGRRDIAIRIMGPAGKVLPAGMVGEIQILSKTTMAGYYQLPDDTKSIFDGRWLRTGDLGTLDEDGYLYFYGMVKPIVNLNGNKVDLKEVRDAILEHSAVAAVEVSSHGSSDPTAETKIYADITPKRHHELNQEDIRAFCIDRLATYKLPQFRIAGPSQSASTSSRGRPQENESPNQVPVHPE
jgi:long-chain acyl-CoA synthetase